MILTTGRYRVTVICFAPWRDAIPRFLPSLSIARSDEYRHAELPRGKRKKSRFIAATSPPLFVYARCRAGDDYHRWSPKRRRFSDDAR